LQSPSGENAHIVTVGSETPSKRKPDKHVVSSHSPGLPIDIGLAASAGSAALMRYQNGLHQVLLLRANDWVFTRYPGDQRKRN